MAGELVPLVMLPRYTSFVGAQDFTTIGMDVTGYERAILNFWRGPIVNTGGTPAFKVTCEESTDQNTWSTCADSTADTSISQDTETQIKPTLQKRWFRVRVTLEGTDPTVSCWSVGFLEMRET